MRILILLCFGWLCLHMQCATSKNNPSTSNSTMATNFDPLWKEVTGFEENGLPKSASDKVQTIYQLAKKEKNDKEIVKALIHLAKYSAQLDAEGLQAAIKTLEAELKTSEGISLAILQSLTAQLYQQYFQMNIWQIRQRTHIEGGADGQTDIDTWSSLDFIEKTRRLYLASVSSDQLKQVAIKDYVTLLTEGKGSDSLRPTLYDILAHRALDYFMDSRADLNVSPDDYVFDDPRLLAQTRQFLELEKDYSQVDPSYYKQVIHLFQSLESFHQSDASKSAWLDVIQKRLQYMYDHYSGSDKNGLYEQALDQWIKLYPAHAATFLLRKAALYQQLGNQYVPSGPDSLYRPYLVRAKEILKDIQARFPKSVEALQAANELISLSNPQIQVEVEQVNVPSTPFRMLMEYRNIATVYGRVVAVTDAVRSEILENRNDNSLNKLLSLNPVNTFSQAIPASEDMQSHKVEIKIDPLASGFYAIILSNQKSFKHGEDVIAVVYTHISNLAYLNSLSSYYEARVRLVNDKKFYVVNRTNGMPMAGVRTIIYEQQYNSSKQIQVWNEVTRATTDQEGSITPLLAGNKNYSIKLETDNDRLWLQDGFYSYSGTVNSNRQQSDILFFLDRSLYRPGQLVYFKGLAIRREENGQASILKNQKINLSMMDANGQEVIKKSFVTNDFGSFNGSFQTPVSGMSGTMNLVSNLNQASVSFQVEEYKRPKFEVTMDTNTTAYRLNESVVVKGKALNFAGNPVDQAQVKYTITRDRWIIPYPWWSSKGFYPIRSNPIIIANGNVITDASGRFNVSFVALPEPNTDRTQEDISFVYTITTDVTDFTGETRSSSTSLRIGTKTLNLKTDIDFQIPNDKLKSILIRSTDLNDLPVPASGQWTLSKLSEPKVKYRKRYWSLPDQFVFNENTYHQLFPLDVFKNEDEVSTWTVEKLIQSGQFEGNKSSSLSSTLEPGIYKLQASSVDRYKQNSELIHYFWIYDLKQPNIPAIKPLVVIQNKYEFEPGEVLSYFVKHSNAGQYVLKADSRNPQLQWNTSRELRSDTLKINESDRGKSFHLAWYMVRDNRIYREEIQYSIPWSTKNLTIQTQTFRDKLIPGQKEEWTLKITGPDKDKFIAEVVASMYDQSLDAYYPHDWRRDLFHLDDIPVLALQSPSFNAIGSLVLSFPNRPYNEVPVLIYRDLNWFGFEFGYRNYYARGGKTMKREEVMNDAAAPIRLESAAQDANAVPPPPIINEEQEQTSKENNSIQPRKNLNETVFFYPDIKSDNDGNVVLKFTMNEALTRWRLMVFGHTSDLKSGYLEKEIVTQKDLMVFPNGPRFVRQGDLLILPAKINNMTSNKLSANARLELFDPMTNKDLNAVFNLTQANNTINILGGQSTALSWKLTVPVDYTGMLGYRVIAEAGKFSDGEENIVPVIANRMLVTETLPLQVKGNSTKTFVFSELINKSNSKTLTNHSFTLEYSTNPLWYAIQALPYIMEYPYECTEQIANRLFSNLLAEQILKANPNIQKVFEDWNKKDLLKSPLQKNEELKYAILSETPWVKEALSEAEQQKMIALLFDLNRMSNEKSKAIQVLQERQLSNGGFPWFTGRDDWYITQYLVETFGHLKQLGLLDANLNNMVEKAVSYCDAELRKYYDELKKTAGKNEIGLPQIAIQYLYARSFFKDLKLDPAVIESHDYFLKAAEKNWLKQNVYNQGMIALALHRQSKAGEVAKKIIASLKERAQHHDELGMYWKFDYGYHWFELPIETQALLIEAFDEITKDQVAVDDMKLWLLKNKQTSHWPSSKSTAAAIYALLTNGTKWINESNAPEITLGKENVSPKPEEITKGAGYFKTTKAAEQVSSSLASIKITNKNKQVLWGAAYWQYFEDLDKITSSNTLPLTMNKKILVEKIENNKKILKGIDQLSIGDRLVIRIELKVDRPLEYVHLKDMHAAGLEPVNVISQGKYQDGLYYYESTKDVATHFFFDHIRPGTYVFEYPLQVAQAGKFSNGISTIQCMYAPEFTSHSRGEILNIK